MPDTLTVNGAEYTVRRFLGTLYYIDYKCNAYMEQWDFEHWGIRYWAAQAPERTEET